jgi:hypothetical protein
MDLKDLQRKLKHMATPQGQAELVEKRFAHVKCPDHGSSPKLTMRTDREGTMTFCCEKLHELVQAERARSG